MAEINVVVVGGGIAGVSAAYALATHPSRPSVHLVEAEPQLAHHTTGRSAAQFIENYGTEATKTLTKASHGFFADPPPGLVDQPLLEPRGLLSVAGPDQTKIFERTLSEGQAINPSIVEVTPTQAASLFPALRPELVARALHEPDSADIDVAGLHQAFVRGATRAGAVIDTSRRVVALDPGGPNDGRRWTVTTDNGPSIAADIVVNAAGAWGDVVARLAGIKPIGLVPRRRTAFMVPAHHDQVGTEPLVADIAHHWYVKRDGNQYLCSPADETPSEPVDAKPEEIDIARAIDLINAATTLGIRTVNSSWAGLRTFSPDETMVLGPDPDHPGFIWCVGQGGFGIQTSPAAGQLVASLAMTGGSGPYFRHHPLDIDDYLPQRFR